MPGKTGKKGNKKGKKKGASKKLPGRNETAEVVVKRLLKCYEKNCAFTESQMCPGIRDGMKKCIENNSLLVKFILQAPDVVVPDTPPILLDPLLATLRYERYTFIRDLHIWDYPMSYNTVASVALLMEKRFYPIRELEMMDCLLTAPHIERLSRSFRASQSLTTVSFDYNEFGDEGCYKLCLGLSGNVNVVSVSLCYCGLGVISGKLLGEMVSTTAVRDLYLDGNDLECEGVMELIQRCADMAENEAFEREEMARRKAEQEAEEEALRKTGRYSPLRGDLSMGSGTDSARSPSPSAKKKKKKKGKKKKKKEPPPPPRVGPWISKLHIANNGIDGYGKGANFAPVICMKLISSLIMNSDCFAEIDLEDNLIGDLAGRELLEALEKRAEAKLPSMKVRTTHRLNTETFSAIVKLGAGLKKKKKKGKGKKKKKK
ncbi:uncharacterized protein LOC135479631 [Liolophura sinensis]|uniref:uncharacterized protein LOC135479631 n=1 Tax=Liolophura sinensis TaxID=3198878 RepID=UPI0031597FE5